MTDTYFDERSETSPIDWWNEERKKLNVIIRSVNKWTLDGCPEDRVARLLRQIDMGLQTFAAPGCGGDWGDDLLEMQSYITGKTGELP